MFVRSKHNLSSTLFAKCVRGRHLDKLIYQENAWIFDKLIYQESVWIQAFPSLNTILFRTIGTVLMSTYSRSFWSPNCCNVKSAEPGGALVNYASSRSWTNDHLLFPTTVLQALNWWPDIRQKETELKEREGRRFIESSDWLYLKDGGWVCACSWGYQR